MGVVHIREPEKMSTLCGDQGRAIETLSPEAIDGHVCLRCLSLLGVQRMNKLICSKTPLGCAVKEWAYRIPAR